MFILLRSKQSGQELSQWSSGLLINGYSDQREAPVASITSSSVIFYVCQQGNIVTCGVLGAYGAVLAVNAYVHTSLSYITLNVLKRLLNDDFSAAFTDVPFQAIGEFPKYPTDRPVPGGYFQLLFFFSFSSRLWHALGVGGAWCGRHRAAAVPRALTAFLPTQPVPHVAAGAWAAAHQRAGSEPPLPLTAQPPPGQSAQDGLEEGAGRGAHASAPVALTDSAGEPGNYFLVASLNFWWIFLINATFTQTELVASPIVL